MDSNIGGLKLLNRYQLQDRLGRGGMGEVYQGMDLNLDRPVAVKVLHGHLSDEDGFRTRFEREAKTMAALNHRHIASVFDYGCDEGHNLYLIVMEYLSGGLLEDRMELLSRQTLPIRLDAARHALLPLLEAIGYAHQRGMIHRDIKPSNILFNEAGEPVLADFGLARLITSDRLTATGMTIGTPAYMAPEQGMGEPGDARSDLYSMGIILYELLSGDTPFHSETPFGLIMQHVNEPPPLLGVRVPGLPAGLEKVVARALAKQPVDRYQSALEFHRDLGAVLESDYADAPSTIQLEAYPPTDTTGKTIAFSRLTQSLSAPIRAVRQRPMLLWGMLAALAVILAGVLVWDEFQPDPDPAEVTEEPLATLEGGGLPAMTVPDTGASTGIESMAGPINLNDTFDDPGSGWPVQATGMITYVYNAGKYTFTNAAPAEGATAIFDAAYTFEDVYLEAQAELIDGQTASAYGLIFRYQDEGHFYVFTASGLGQVSIWALEDGVWRELRGAGWTDSDAVNVDEPNTLSVIAEGDHLVGLVNGDVVIEVDDATYDSGAVGLYVATTTASVDAPLAQIAFDDYIARHNIPSMTEP